MRAAAGTVRPLELKSLCIDPLEDAFLVEVVAALGQLDYLELEVFWANFAVLLHANATDLCIQVFSRNHLVVFLLF